MKKNISLQVTVISLSLVVFLIIFLAPKNYSVAKANDAAVNQNVDNEIQKQVDEVKAKLPAAAKASLEEWEQALDVARNTDEKALLLDSITRFWDKEMRPAIGVIYMEKKSQLTHKPEHWMETGDRYLAITAFLKEGDRIWAYGKAEEAFAHVLEEDPENTEAKISMGICQVNSNPEAPMQGIALIREVLEKDSTNLRAIVELGHFSVTSAQFPKAIERYQQALRVRPDFHEALLFLGETYVRMGDLNNAEKYLIKYKNTQENKEVQWQIENRIKELKEMGQKN